MARKWRRVLTSQGVALEPELELIDLPFDEPPSAPDSKNLEAIMSGTGGDPNWSYVSSDAAAVTNQSAGHFFDTAVPAHSYNWNTDVKGGLVLAPASGKSLYVHRAFVPGTGVRWAVIAKVASLTAFDTDDDIILGVSKLTPAGGNPADSAQLQLQISAAASGTTAMQQRFRYVKWNANVFTAVDFTGATPPVGGAYLALAGRTDNSIWAYYSLDGVGWVQMGSIAGNNINSNVNFLFLQVSDTAGSLTHVGVVKWIRFLSDTTLVKAGFGF